MIQDIVTNKGIGNGVKETPKPVSERKAASISKILEPQKVQISETAPKERSNAAPVFSSMEDSPIFEKMKQHNKDRESFSDDFDADKNNGGHGMFGKILISLGGLAVIGAFLYGLFFHSAVLVITPKHADVAFTNQEFIAGETQTAENDPLAFQLMTLSEEASADLTATGEKNVTNKSSGKIVIYNDFGPQPQPLIKNTRFQTPDGKIYRIRNSIVIPGQKVADGKKIPGSFEVDVYADAAGAEYNIELVDFTIPGFKGSPRYEKFYARSKTPMTGGASGLMKVVSPADIQKAKDMLTVELKEKLSAQVAAQKPKGTVLYKDAVFYSFTDSMDNDTTTKSADDKSVKLIMKGSLTAVLFNAEDLSKHIMKVSVTPVDVSLNDRILITDIEALGFAPKNVGGIPVKEGDIFSFTLNGAASAVWQVDTAALAGKLAGLKKADYKNVFAEFPGIEKANAHIRPFWKTKFPSDAAKIRVEITPN